MIFTEAQQKLILQYFIIKSISGRYPAKLMEDIIDLERWIRKEFQK
jgi:hypothetical protein